MFKTILLLLWASIISSAFAGPYHNKVDYIFPLPESQMLPPKTTVIVRPQKEVADAVASLQSFISLKSVKGEIDGKAWFATDNQTIIFKPNSTLTRGDTITVTIQTSQFSETDLEYWFVVAANEKEPQQAVYSPQPITVDNNIHFAKANVRQINGIAVPRDFPDIDVQEHAPGADGKIFFATRNAEPGYGTYLVICNKDGSPYFYRKLDDPYGIGNFDVQPNGQLTCFLYKPRHHIVMDSSYVVIDTLKAGHGYITDNHELMLLENGHTLLIAEEALWFDLSDSIDGGREKVKVLGNHLQELDAEENVIFEWRCWDHFNITDAVTGDLKAAYIDYVHMNSIAIDFDGHLILSSRHLSEITKINRDTGDIIWRMGGRHNQFSFIDGAEKFSCQHDVRPVTDVPNQYTIFDNGNQKNPRISQAVQFEIDPAAMTVSKVWEFRRSPEWFIKGKGAVQRLENGNTYIDWTDMPPVAATEVNENGELVYEFYAHGISTYRSREYDWNGVAPRPYLVIENCGSVINLLFNKFGDEKVTSYNIYQSIGGQPFQLIDSTANTWYVLENPLNQTEHIVRVTALYDDGHESDFSNQESFFVDYVSPGTNMVQNGEFDSDESWTFHVKNDAVATGGIDELGQYKIDISNGGTSLTEIQLVQENITLINGREYELSFSAYAENNRVIEPILTSLKNPGNDYSQLGGVVLNKRSQNFSFRFTMQFVSDAAARLVFNCGQFNENIFLDNVSMTEIAIPSVVFEKQQENRFTSLSNYPNPFNESTLIRYSIFKDEHVCLNVYNMNGQLLATLVDGFKQAGQHRVKLDANDFSSGVYFYRLSTATLNKSGKLLILR